jgi:SAM-dependent methyltransferase
VNAPAGYAALASFFDDFARIEPVWARPNRTYHRLITQILRFQTNGSPSVLEIGCGSGDLLAALAPGRGVGVDVSPGMIAEARRRHPELELEIPRRAVTAAIADRISAPRLIVEHEPIARLEARSRPFGELHHHLRAADGGHAPWLQPAHDLEDDEIAVAEHCVDREPHEEHVDRPGPAEEHALVGVDPGPSE